MKRYLWILIAIVLAAAILGGTALLFRSRTPSEGASSPNGETEIIPDDPDEPWPDLSADASSEASSDAGAASLPTSSKGGNTGSSISSGTAVPSSDAATAPGSATASGSAAGSGNTASSGSSASSGGASSSGGGSGNTGSNPDSGVSPTPNPGTDDSDPIVSEEELHEYELPYIPLS